MKIVNGITRFFYTIILVLLGVILMMVALNLIPQEKLLDAIALIYAQHNFRLITGFAGLLLIGFSLLIVQLALSRLEREKTLAFDNPDGRVTVSLTAIEDFMKKLGSQIPEIRELKPKVSASKKAVIVDTKIVLYSEASIPNVTEKIQSVVKTRVQDMLGIEEPIVVRVHIHKLVDREEPKKKKHPDKEKKEEVPQFRGIEYSED